MAPNQADEVAQAPTLAPRMRCMVLDARELMCAGRKAPLGAVARGIGSCFSFRARASRRPGRLQ
jgi:hypothetical protein